jgi:NADH-quinone oxidoreductase subunit J
VSAYVDLAAEVTKTSTGEAVQFWILAIVATAGALGTVLLKKAVHSALALASTMLCLALFYMAQGAVFLGVVQIVVYTGAIMMLFLFVLMLVGVSSADSLKEQLRGQRWAAAGVGVGFGLLLVAGIGNAGVKNFTGTGAADAAHGGNVQSLAHLIFTRYVWVFEITSALLITAAVGTMVLAHRERMVPRKTQRELSEDRIRDNKFVAPLPAPGVFARHNSVDTPALLPDGTPAELSVNQTLRARGQVRDISAERIRPVGEIGGDGEAWPEADPEERGEVPPARQEAVVVEDETPGDDSVSAGASSGGDAK